MAKKKEFEDLNFETLNKPSQWDIGRLSLNEPRCWNGEVSVRKYRVRVELIDEPMEVIHKRIIDLWERCDNIHHYGPIREEAEKYGLDLNSYRVGEKRGEKTDGQGNP